MKGLPYVELFDFRGTGAFKIIHKVQMTPRKDEEDDAKKKKEKDKGKEKEKEKSKDKKK